MNAHPSFFFPIPGALETASPPRGDSFDWRDSRSHPLEFLACASLTHAQDAAPRFNCPRAGGTRAKLDEGPVDGAELRFNPEGKWP